MDTACRGEWCYLAPYPSGCTGTCNAAEPHLGAAAVQHVFRFHAGGCAAVDCFSLQARDMTMGQRQHQPTEVSVRLERVLVTNPATARHADGVVVVVQTHGMSHIQAC